MRRRDQCVTLLTLVWTAMVLYWTSTLNINGDGVMASSNLGEATPAPTEERIVQRLPPPKIKWTAEKEIEMACEEVDCVKKCTVTYPDRKEKFDSCRRTCGKERCIRRCKNEPNPSYVERELKREKCLDRCGEKDEKCKANCDNDAKKCKDRCKERSQKYFCVRDLDKLGQDDEEAITVVDASMFSDDAGVI